jgi:hypothetical protein
MAFSRAISQIQTDEENFRKIEVWRLRSKPCDVFVPWFNPET